MRYLTFSLILLIALLPGCAKPTEYDFCLEAVAGYTACGDDPGWDCEMLNVELYCDPEEHTFDADKCTIAHRVALETPWECLAEASTVCHYEGACPQP